MKMLPVSEENHDKVILFKIKKKLKTIDQAISKMFEDLEWTA
jgi:hypothetical protein